MASRQAFRLHARAAALAVLVSLRAGAAFAADVAVPDDPAAIPEGVGVVCTLNDPFALAATAATLPWPSVWLGHFSGGHPATASIGRTFVDWRDEKVCFATRALCEAWVADLRRSYSDPEGDWTCLFLR